MKSKNSCLYRLRDDGKVEIFVFSRSVQILNYLVVFKGMLDGVDYTGIDIYESRDKKTTHEIKLGEPYSVGPFVLVSRYSQASGKHYFSIRGK